MKLLSTVILFITAVSFRVQAANYHLCSAIDPTTAAAVSGLGPIFLSVADNGKTALVQWGKTKPETVYLVEQNYRPGSYRLFFGLHLFQGQATKPMTKVFLRPGSDGYLNMVIVAAADGKYENPMKFSCIRQR